MSLNYNLEDMKTIITTALIIGMALNLFAGITPESKIINTEKVTVFAQTDGLFESATYDEVSELMRFITKSDISVIQIMNADGELEFQLPVMTNDVQLNTNLFGSGEFKIGFVMQGENQVYYSKVNIK